MFSRNDKPQGRFVRLYESPDEFDVLSYWGAWDKWVLWVDKMPHKKFRPLFVRPFLRQHEPKVAYKATWERRGHKTVLCIYIKEWGHITDNEWQLIAVDDKFQGRRQDWESVQKYARSIIRGSVPVVMLEK